MAKIICNKCNRTGDSKCPHCRSIFGGDETATGMLDSTLSHRLKIDKDSIVLKKYNVPDYDEENHKVLSMVVNSINRAAAADGISVEEVCQTLCCVHEWQFAPHCYSDIGCGHRAPADPDFEWNKQHTAILISMGWDPEELCVCGDKLKAHEDNLECVCCECALFTPVGSPAALVGKEKEKA